MNAISFTGTFFFLCSFLSLIFRIESITLNFVCFTFFFFFFVLMEICDFCFVLFFCFLSWFDDWVLDADLVCCFCLVAGKGEKNSNGKKTSLNLILWILKIGMPWLSRVNSCVRLNLVEVVLSGIPIYGKSDAEDFVLFYYTFHFLGYQTEALRNWIGFLVVVVFKALRFR